MFKLISRICMLMILLAQPALAQKRPLEFADMFSMKRITDAHISPDGKWIAYKMTAYDIPGNSGNADIFIVSADGKMVKQLTNHPKGDASPRWSPDGKKLAFISARDGLPQIYTVDIESGATRKVSDIPTGVKNFAWSPDGKLFAIATDMYPDAKTPKESADMEAVKKSGMASGRVIDRLLFRHWNEWRDGKYSHVVVAPVGGGETVDITPGAADTPPISLGSKHDFVWSPDGENICFARNMDDVVAASTNNDLWLTGKNGGEITKITANNGNDNGPRFSPGGKTIAYMSMARAGFEADQKNLVVYDIATKKARNLTESLDRSVSDFVWGQKGKKLYFYVPHHGRHRLYEVDRQSGKRRLLLDKIYMKGIDISPDGKYLIILQQKAVLPTEIFRFDLKKKTLTQLTFANRELLAKLEMNSLEEYWFTGANGDSVHLLLLKPPHFDLAKKYPLINLIHGGPQGAWGDDFHYRWNSEMFAAPGYVVIMINFHASRGYGQKFCDAVSKNWGGWPYEDIMTGTRWAIENFDFIDGQRVGAAGASYGGFMVNWIEGHNEDGLFKTLVSHDGVFEQVSMFGATEELWFPMWEFNGLPWEESSLYQKWNPVNYVDDFNTPMLVIHGERDYRVPYTQGLQLFTALQMKGVDSRLLFYPDEDHFVQKPQNAQLWWKTVHDWLAKYLKP